MSRYHSLFGIAELASTAGLVAPQRARDAAPAAPIPGDTEADWVRADAVFEALAFKDGAPIRHVHHDRDFGIGYGNSSGYGTERHYVNDWNPPRFSFR